LEPKDPLRWIALSNVYAREHRLAEAERSRRRAARLRRLGPSPRPKRSSDAG
jgi:hypothetical protein